MTKSDIGAMSKNTTSFKQKLEINAALEKHCSTVNGFSLYEKGWSDKRIAAEMPFPCTTINVAGVRKEVFGLTLRTPKADDTDCRITHIERRLNAISHNLIALSNSLGFVFGNGSVHLMEDGE